MKIRVEGSWRRWNIGFEKYTDVTYINFLCLSLAIYYNQSITVGAEWVNQIAPGSTYFGPSPRGAWCITPLNLPKGQQMRYVQGNSYALTTSDQVVNGQPDGVYIASGETLWSTQDTYFLWAQPNVTGKIITAEAWTNNVR